LTAELDDRAKASLGKFTRRQVLELDTCAHCALCTENCPAYHGSRDPLHAPGVRSAVAVKLYDKKHNLLTRLFGNSEVTKEDVERLSESAYHCTLCGRCMETCPFGFQTHELWCRVREIVADLGGTPQNVARLGNMLEESMNPYGLEPDERLDWVDYTGMDEVPEKERAEVAYFVGCTTAFKGANHDVAFSIASILDEVDEDWTVLGEDEWCCGNPSLLSGDEHTAREYALHNVEALESRGVKKVITGCAGCYRVFRFEYPKLMGREPGFEILHAVEYLRDLLVSGRLKLDATDEKVIYHDPCELSRLGGVTEAPREALSHMTREPLEFEDHGIDVKCCGGGGLLQAVDNEMRLDIVTERLTEAKEKGADVLVSACPACKLAFTDGVRERGVKIEVLDLLELAAKRLGAL